MKKKKMISLLLCLCLTATSISPVWAVNDSEVIAAAEEEIFTVAENSESVPYAEKSDDIIAEGYCGGEGDGTNITWTLNSDGLLTISGNGAMADYSATKAPWYSLEDQISKLELKDGITKIGNHTFSYLNNVTGDLIIPDSVLSIGQYAFSGCNDLITVTLSGSVEEIGDNAFYQSGLTSVEIPNSVKIIGKSAFSMCDNLRTVIVSPNVETIGYYAFSQCDNLESVYISDIDAWMNIDFLNNTSNPLSSANCLYLNNELVTSVCIPDGTQVIKDNIFVGGTYITKITIPDSVESIGSQAFSGCGITELDIPDGVVSIMSGAFSNCYNLPQTTIPDSVTTIDAGAFSDCSNLLDISIGSGVETIGNNAFLNCYSLRQIELPENLKSIGWGAFQACSSLAKIVIPEKITNIKRNTFAECMSLLHVTIPENVTSIENDAFYNCQKLIEVCNNSTLSITSGSDKYGEIGKYAEYIYSDTSGKSHLSEVDNYIFFYHKDKATLAGYYGTKTVITLPETFWAWNDTIINNYEIGKRAFCNSRGHYSLDSLTNAARYITEVTIPDSVTGIGDWAFYELSDSHSISKVELGNGITYIGESAFRGCSNLTNIIIPDSVKSIGSHAFYSSGLIHVELGENVSDIGSFAFYGNHLVELCNNSPLTRSDFSAHDNFESVKHIYSSESGQSHLSLKNDCVFLCHEDKAYLVRYLGNDSELILPDSFTAWDNTHCTSYEVYAFASANNPFMEKVVVSDAVTYIGEEAFFSCDILSNVKISSSVTEIEMRAFLMCDDNMSVFFLGDAPCMVKTGSIYSSFPDKTTLFYMDGANGWTDSEFFDADAGTWNGYKLSKFTPSTAISTTFDTSAITLAEGETFDFAGIVSTTAENGLEAVQIDIHKYGNDKVGITHFRKSNTDEEDPLTGNSFDLSAIPSFTGGDTLTGQTENTITLAAGTSWNVYLYAKDTDGNTLGGSVVMRLDIVEAENENPLIGNKYVQTTNIDSFYGSPYIEFNDETTGEFMWVNPETGESGTDDFTYYVSGDTVTLTAGAWLLGNVADEIVLDIVDEDCLEVAEIIDYSITEELSIGCTGVGDRFEVEMEQVKPEVDGLQKNYTLTEGEDLSLNFTVTASGENALLKAVTLKEPDTDTVFERKPKEGQPDLNEPSVTFNTTISDLSVGEHNLVVYATATNYNGDPTNEIFEFTVTVKEKQQSNTLTEIDTSTLEGKVEYTIFLNETDLNYDRVNADDNDAGAIGMFQWRGNRALIILQRIIGNQRVVMDSPINTITEAEARAILGDTFYDEIVNSVESDWDETRTFTKDEKSRIQTLLVTPAGLETQRDSARNNTNEYLKSGRKAGLIDEQALIVYTDIYNIGSGHASRIVKAAIANANGDATKVTAEIMLDAYTEDGKLGIDATDDYERRRVNIRELLEKWYGSSTDEPPVVEPDEPVIPDVPDTDNIVIAGVDIGYKNGQYFTVNGRACDRDKDGKEIICCHDIRSTYIRCASGESLVGDSWKEAPWTDTDGIYGTPGAVYECNCKHNFDLNGETVELGASQCVGYARYCSRMVFGEFPTAIYTNVTIDNVKEKLLQSKPGSYLHNRTEDYKHAIVLISADQNEITYTDANFTGACKIQKVTKSWAEFCKAKYIKYGSYTIYGEKTDTVSITKVTETYSGDIITEGANRDGYLTDGTTSLMLKVEVKGAKRIYMQVQTLSGSSVAGTIPYDETINEQDINVTTTHNWVQVIPEGTPAGTYKVIISVSNSSTRNDSVAVKDDFTFYIKVTGSGNTVVTPQPTPEDEKSVYLTELTNLLNADEISQTEFNNRISVLEEASRYCNLEWTTQVSFHTWKGKNGGYNSNENMIINGETTNTKYYIPGVTYKGMPYCSDDDLENNYETIDGFLSKLENAKETKDLQGTLRLGKDDNGNPKQRTETTLYGIDCAGLVLRSYKTLSNYTHSYKGTGRLTEVFSPTSNPKPGDIMLKPGHVMIYAGKSAEGTIMVYESVADGEGISGCVYRKARSPEDYKFYSYNSISKE